MKNNFWLETHLEVPFIELRIYLSSTLDKIQRCDSPMSETLGCSSASYPRSSISLSYTGHQATESAGRVVFGRVELDLSSLGLSSGASLVEFLDSRIAQLSGLLLRIVRNAPGRIEV